RRRHTRFSRDWSSDVCSSDLARFTREEGCDFAQFDSKVQQGVLRQIPYFSTLRTLLHCFQNCSVNLVRYCFFITSSMRSSRTARSEERRVGKESRYGGWRCIG